MAMAPATILVTGDHGVDYDIYLPSDDDMPPPGTPPAIVRASVGGAGVIFRILRAAQAGASPEPFRVRFLAAEGLGVSPTAAIWSAYDLGSVGAGLADQKTKVWRARRSIGLGHVDEASVLPKPAASLSDEDPRVPSNTDVLVVADNAGVLRGTVPDALAGLLKAEPDALPRHVILKTGAPVGHGTLWWMLVGCPAIADRLVVIVSVADLRRADVRVSQGISWERTAEDLTRELMTSTAMASLRHARHLVVTLQNEGALWLTRPDDPAAAPRVRLIFDPACMEGEWPRRLGAPGGAYGYLSVFTAALALDAVAGGLADGELQLERGIERGLLGMRALRVVGHGAVHQANPGLPAAGLADLLARPRVEGNASVAGAQLSLARLGTFGRTDVPTSAADGAWRMLESTDRQLAGHPLFGKAHRVALFGTVALGDVPYARFGKIFTADRAEIEALRNLKRLMDEYSLSRYETKPLSLAVFGPPGAGKSFGIKQIAETVIEEKRRAFLEFNLSQFDDPGDLMGAFHQVRDKVLEGKLPVVFWDEFDSQDYRWLQYLLAPMQDGKFQEGQITHPLGPCIFVFAGATSYTCENFGPPEEPASGDAADRERHRASVAGFRLKKGPDFKSRLHGFLNVFGPNPRQRFTGSAWEDDPADVCYPVRRAILLRSLLGLMDERNGAKRLQIDQGLLGALLDIDYRHGSRSFEKIVVTLKQHDGAGLRRSALPSDEVLAMNVNDLGAFKRLLDRKGILQPHVQLLAAAMHARWTESAEPGNIFRKAFADLPAETRGDNVAAALRISDILALAGLELVPTDDPRPHVAGVDAVLTNHLETLAEEEHRGWMEVRMKNGWRPCARTDDERGRLQQRAARLSDCLVPYADLPDVERQKDRDTIRWYPEAAALAGLKIVARAGAARPPA